MRWELAGKTALITGGASGIGAALARQLTARGTRVALIDRDAKRLATVAEELGAASAAVDVTDRAALRAAVDELAVQLGGLDIAVANAGIATGGPLRLVDPQTVEDTLEVNLLGVWRTVSAALPHVVARRGHLLLVASAAAIVPTPGLGAYSAAKAGVESLGRTLRVELRRHGVTVGVAYYLFLDTPMVREGEALPTFSTGRDRMPGPIARTYPLEPAIAATVEGLEKRARRVMYPGFLRWLAASRGLLDLPLLEREGAKAIPDMEARFNEHAARVGPDAAARPPARY
jgi:NAD(P)-dependent dehydrogenase (short-subunit alcohol dehydrogenase family)